MLHYHCNLLQILMTYKYKHVINYTYYLYVYFTIINLALIKLIYFLIYIIKNILYIKLDEIKK